MVSLRKMWRHILFKAKLTNLQVELQYIIAFIFFQTLFFHQSANSYHSMATPHRDSFVLFLPSIFFCFVYIHKYWISPQTLLRLHVYIAFTGSQDSEVSEEQKKEKILELRKKEKLLQEKLLQKVEELKKICLREAVRLLVFAPVKHRVFIHSFSGC